MLRTTAWDDYGLIDCGGGRKLERYGPYRVVRPEPQCLWRPRLADGGLGGAPTPCSIPRARRTRAAGASAGRPMEPLPLAWRGVRFHGRFTAFRHLGFFPEQAANWDWLDERLRTSAGRCKVLNLFGYTGVASLVCAAAGAQVTHVDASKRAVGWARENAELSGLADRADPLDLTEDARKYVQREVPARLALRRDHPRSAEIRPRARRRGLAAARGPARADRRLRGPARRTTPRFLLLNAYAERISGLALAGLLGRGAGGPRRDDRLGRAGADGGSRRARRRPVVLRPLERAVSRAPSPRSPTRR